jgi:hypothetical protein
LLRVIGNGLPGIWPGAGSFCLNIRTNVVPLVVSLLHPQDQYWDLYHEKTEKKEKIDHM